MRIQEGAYNADIPSKKTTYWAMALMYCAASGLVIGILAQIAFFLNWPILFIRFFSNWFAVFAIGGIIIDIIAAAHAVSYVRWVFVQKDKNQLLREGIWTALFRECPRWMRRLTVLCFLYAGVNFFFFDVKSHSMVLSNEESFMLLTPVLTVLFSISVAMLYSAVKFSDGYCCGQA